MKYTFSLAILFMFSSTVWGISATSFSTATVRKLSVARRSAGARQQPKATRKKEPARALSISPNIIPIITLNYKEANAQGVPQHEPCAATRLTPTLVFTAAHCLIGGLTHGSRIQAGVFEADDGTEGLIFSEPRNDSFIKPNAQVFLYRPNWHHGGQAASPLDFAVVVLDKKVNFNAAAAQNITANLDVSLANFINDLGNPILQEMKKEFDKQATIYTKFINKQLDNVGLLTMTANAAANELRGRNLFAYFWNGHQYDANREPVRILNQTSKGTGGEKNSHLLLFGGEEFYPGTSGSPVFDTQRKVVVSAASGVFSDGSNGGGLIDHAVCQWVKQHDSAAKCLVVHEENAPIEKESPETSAWGR